MVLTAKPPTQELIDIVGALEGEWSGYKAMCRCPAHADSTPSLSLRQGDRGILVHCFAGCDPAAILLELRRIQPGQHYAHPGGASRERKPDIGRIWDGGVDVAGTLGQIYLGSRFLVPLPPDLRFHPRCPYLPRGRTVFLPALLVPVREGRRITALQRIFLDSQGRPTRKATLGRPEAGAWRPVNPDDVLAVAEGFETAAAFTLLYDVPCWATLGAERLHQLAIPSSVTRLYLAGDNDPEGMRAIARAHEAYKRPDREILPAVPPNPGDDWADVLTGRCGAGVQRRHAR